MASLARGSDFVGFWRRTDVDHLSLSDRVYWILRWVFNDPQGDIHGGMPATLSNALRELVWVARTYGQETRPAHPARDVVRQNHREDADGTELSDPDGAESKQDGGEEQMSYTEDAGHDSDGSQGASSAAVSDILDVVARPNVMTENQPPTTAISEGASHGDDVLRSVSPESMVNAQRFWSRMHTRKDTASKHSAEDGTE
ncbi:hypothetical protein A4X13_0g2805 [Tilletia indica]|uniref:Uncharacterized protein n=1 Tax=Tilletia indica TaxID=43049 RepID=A0A177TQV2_9BASI|nr:hypothetical protein A4X13_0g2805 [Tilletia indica]